MRRLHSLLNGSWHSDSNFGASAERPEQSYILWQSHVFRSLEYRKKNNLKVPIWRIEKNLDVFSLSPPSFATLERTCATKTKEDLLKVNIITALFVWQLRLFYDEDAANLNVTVIGGEGLAPKESTTPPNPYVRIYFLPDKRYRCLGLLCFLLNKCHWLLLFFCLFFAF